MILGESRNTLEQGAVGSSSVQEKIISWEIISPPGKSCYVPIEKKPQPEDWKSGSYCLLMKAG